MSRFSIAVPLALLFALAAVKSPDLAIGKQDSPQELSEPAPGAFLVAKRALADPRFRGTVILLLEHDDGGSLGVIVNRITGISLAEAVPEWSHLDRRRHFLFFGGPVQMTGLSYLARRGTGAGEARWHLDGIRGGFDATELQWHLEQDFAVEDLRIYFGYAGWGPGQLAAELAREDWYLAEADPDDVFRADPASLWRELIGRLDPPWI